MSEKWFVVSESELVQLVSDAIGAYMGDVKSELVLQKTEAIARARPVTRGEFDSMGETVYAWEEDV